MLPRPAAAPLTAPAVELSIVVPAYNEGRQIVTTVQRLLDSVTQDCEVLEL